MDPDLVKSRTFELIRSDEWDPIPRPGLMFVTYGIIIIINLYNIYMKLLQKVVKFVVDYIGTVPYIDVFPMKALKTISFLAVLRYFYSMPN
jgi:hypothetical protein